MNSRLRWAIPDERVDLAGEQIDPGQQAERAMAFCTHDPARSSHGGLALAANPVPSWRWPGFQASRRRRRSRPACSISALAAAFPGPGPRGRHTELPPSWARTRRRGVQIVAHLVRLDFLLTEKLAHGALSQTGETLVTRRRSALARIWRAKSRVVHSSCG